MERKNRKTKISNIVIPIAIFLLTTVSVSVVSYFYDLTMEEVIRNGIMSAMGSGIIIFLITQAKYFELLDYDNKNYYGRFFNSYLICLLISLVCGMMPEGGWPFVPVFVLLSLFSSSLVGIASGFVLLMISILLSGVGVGAFLLYFISGLGAVCVFRKLDENYKVGIPIVISSMLLMVSLTANIVLFYNDKINFAQFQLPMMNVIVTVILLLIILKIFSSLVIYKMRNHYLEINDPEYPLLVEMKKQSREEYYRAVHTAYLSDKIAKKLRLNEAATKALGYYHRIGFLYGGSHSMENINRIVEEYRFPEEVINLLREYVQGEKAIVQKEAVVVHFADTVIATILKAIAENSEEQINYDKIIEYIFAKRLEKETLNQCELTIREWYQMKKIFKEEKLYYDFLR